MALFVSDITSACFCMISRHYQVYSSTTVYQRASLTILPTGNYNLPFMGHKIPYLSSLLVTCHQSSRLYGVFKLAIYIENLHYSVRFIISDTALKFSTIIHYYQTSSSYFENCKTKHVMLPNGFLNSHIETGSKQYL